MKKVRVYDFITSKVIEIPIEELAPEMIKVVIEGKDGEYWVDVNQLNPSNTFKVPSFESDAKRKIKEIRLCLHEVYPHTYKFWEDGFRVDKHQKEIDLWFAGAKNYQRITGQKHYTLPQKKDIFKILVSILNNGIDAKVVFPELRYLDKNEVDEIFDKFWDGLSRGTGEV